MNILVRDLSEEMTEARLMGIFQKFGAVNSVSIVFDKLTGRSRGFGFIDMPQEDQARAAIANLHHKKIDGGKIRVKEANPKYGPAYFAEGEGSQTTVQKLVPTHPDTPPGAQSKKREFRPRPGRGGYGGREFKPRGKTSGRTYSRYAKRDDKSRDFGTGGGQNRRPYGERTGFPPRGERPFSQGPRREGYRPGYKPWGERNAGPRSEGQRDRRPYAQYPAREGNRQDSRPGFKPRGERPFSRGPRREGYTPEFKPRKEWDERNRRDFRPGGERSERAGFPPRAERPFSHGTSGFGQQKERNFGQNRRDESGRRSFGSGGNSGGGSSGFKPRGERNFGQRSSGGRSGRPFSRYRRDSKPRGPR